MNEVNLSQICGSWLITLLTEVCLTCLNLCVYINEALSFVQVNQLSKNSKAANFKMNQYFNSNAFLEGGSIKYQREITNCQREIL